MKDKKKKQRGSTLVGSFSLWSFPSLFLRRARALLFSLFSLQFPKSLAFGADCWSLVGAAQCGLWTIDIVRLGALRSAISKVSPLQNLDSAPSTRNTEITAWLDSRLFLAQFSEIISAFFSNDERGLFVFQSKSKLRKPFFISAVEVNPSIENHNQISKWKYLFFHRVFAINRVSHYSFIRS